MLDEKDVNNPEVVNQEGVEPASPAEPQEPKETVEAPIEPVTPEEPEQQVPYERFKAVNDERKALLDLVQRQQQPQQVLVNCQPASPGCADKLSAHPIAILSDFLREGYSKPDKSRPS